jgi:Ni/Fe-hydrogenase subunit HybB-like protein
MNTHAQVTIFAWLAAAWLLTSGIAAGSAALLAAVQIAQGRWVKPIEGPAQAAARLLVPASAVLCVLVLAGHRWMPDDGELGALFTVRELLVTLVLLVASLGYLRSRGGKAQGPMALAYLFSYVIALSCWAVDFTSGTRHWAPSTILPPFYFMSALLAALAWATVASLMSRSRPLDEECRHDAGKLLFGLTCFWMYLVFASYLPIWYENVPEETGFLFDRLQGPFRAPTLFMLLATGVLPFLMLLTEWAKRRRGLLGLSCISTLLGFGVQCYLFVLPS